MKQLLKTVLLAAALVAGVLAATRWPRINDVETGRTPEYPDLKPRAYRASLDVVVKGARAALARLPRWELVGEGSGPAGAEIQAVHSTRLLRFKDDVTIRFRRAEGRTLVSVRSKSRLGKWDFGQNARNIRELLDALDREVP
jgi:uncharacterized protein (DUF1499 family)